MRRTVTVTAEHIFCFSMRCSNELLTFKVSHGISFACLPSHAVFRNSTKTKGALREELGHLSAGLFKLAEASSTVDDLSKNAAKKQKELQAAQVTVTRLNQAIATNEPAYS